MDSKLRTEQVPQVQLEDTNEYDDFNPTKASQSKVIDYVVDKIAYQGAINGERLCHVRWYGQDAKKDSVEPGDHLPDNFIKAYWRLRIVRNTYIENDLAEIRK